MRLLWAHLHEKSYKNRFYRLFLLKVKSCYINKTNFLQVNTILVFEELVHRIVMHRFVQRMIQCWGNIFYEHAFLQVYTIIRGGALYCNFPSSHNLLSFIYWLIFQECPIMIHDSFINFGWWFPVTRMIWAKNQCARWLMIADFLMTFNAKEFFMWIHF